MNNDFLVSALCRTYNQSKYITDTLNGFAMQQTAFPFVAIVVDDASTDGEQDVINDYIEKHFDCSSKSAFTQWETEDARWTFARHLENKNCYFVAVYLKRNLHQEMEKKDALVRDWTNTKYVSLCEGDDYWTDPLKLQKEVGFLEAHGDYTMCCTGFTQSFEGRDNEKSAIVYDFDDISIEHLLKGLWVGTLTVVYRREVMDDYQPPIPDLPFGDLPFWCQLALIGKIKYFRDVTANYRCLRESACHSKDLKKQLRFGLDTMRAREYYALKTDKVNVVQPRFSKDSHYYLEQCYKNKWFDFPMDTLWHFVKEYGHPSGYDKLKYWGMKSKFRYRCSKALLMMLKNNNKIYQVTFAIGIIVNGVLLNLILCVGLVMGVIRKIKRWINHDIDMRKAVSKLSKDISETRNLVDLIYYSQLTTYLREKTLHSDSSGITQERLCDEEVVVSLTSFGQRIYDVFLAIESIMQGSVLPNRIVLWLAEDEFNPSTLPQTLLNQQERGLQIEYCKDIKSYKKLIPALKRYPDALLITIDDDVVYDFDMLERFLLSHKENPNAVCASRLRRVSFDQNGNVRSYLKWLVDDETVSSPLLFPVGMGGVLYPPHCLDNEVLNEKAFMDLCPYADDVWFFSMARMKGTSTVRVRVRSPQGYLYDLPSSAIDALSTQNTNRAFCRNDSQIKAVFEKYQIGDCLVKLMK